MTKTTAWLIGSILAVAGLTSGFNSLYLKNSSALKLAFVTQSAFDCSQVTDVPQSECNALVALYDTTNGDNWTNKQKWKESTSVCQWKGITCKNGYVNQIQLINNQLSGTLPPQIGDFTQLDSLVLSDNKLSGSIPKEIGNLLSLKGLHLTNNQLSGPIPKEIGKLKNLNRLSFAGNKLSDGIPKEITELFQLQYLHLSNNLLSGTIPKEIGKLTQLKALQLNSNKLSGPIPKEIGNLTQLEELGLYSNRLNGFIPKEIGNLTKLFSLHLSINQLSGVVPAELGNLTHLNQLGFYNNQLCGKLPESLSSFTLLTHLDIDNNKLITGAYSSSFIEWMTNKGFKFGAQDSQACPAYCGDGICQASEMNKFGGTTCENDCKIIKTSEPQGPTKSSEVNGFSNGTTKK